VGLVSVFERSKSSIVILRKPRCGLYLSLCRRVASGVFGEENSAHIMRQQETSCLNVDLDGTHVAVCFGYPPHCVFRQSVYTALVGRGGLLSKVDASEDVAQELLSAAQETGLFQAAGRELKCIIDRALTEEEIDLLISWCETTASTIKKHGLRE